MALFLRSGGNIPSLVSRKVFIRTHEGKSDKCLPCSFISRFIAWLKKISFRKCLSSKNFVNMNFRLLEFSDVCFIFVANLIFMV